MLEEEVGIGTVRHQWRGDYGIRHGPGTETYTGCHVRRDRPQMPTEEFLANPRPDRIDPIFAGARIG